MKKTFSSVALFIALALLLSGHPQEESQGFPLSLESCIQKTLKNNLGLAADLLAPVIADASVSLASHEFVPTLAMGYNEQDQKTVSYSALDAAGTYSTLQNDFSAQISQSLPTGGSLIMSLTGYKIDTTRKFQTINPRFGSTLRFNLSHPFLRDFGWKIARRELLLAQNNRDISEQSLNQNVEDVIYRAKSAYWNYVYSLENLKVRRQSLKLAQELLEKNKAEVEAGTLAPIEIFTAQADVSTREADILEAETLVRNSEDLLKTIMNLAAELPNVESLRIEPTDTPSVARLEVDLDQALGIALENRPDLKSARIGLDTKQLNLGYYRNQRLPDLRLQAQYWSPGVSGTQILYQGGNALTGIVIGIIPGGRSQAMRDVFDFKYKNWSVGLTLSIPMTSIFSRAAVVQAGLDLKQAQLRVKNLEQQVFLEIRTAVRSVETNFQRIQAYRSARENAQKKLEAEEEKFKVGLSTNYFILQYQRDLANAMIMELKALVDYNIAQAALYRAQGRGMEYEHVSSDDLGTVGLLRSR